MNLFIYKNHVITILLSQIAADNSKWFCWSIRIWNNKSGQKSYWAPYINDADTSKVPTTRGKAAIMLVLSQSLHVCNLVIISSPEPLGSLVSL